MEVFILEKSSTNYLAQKKLDHNENLGIEGKNKKAMAFTGNRSKSSIGISSFKVKRLFSG